MIGGRQFCCSRSKNSELRFSQRICPRTRQFQMELFHTLLHQWARVETSSPKHHLFGGWPERAVLIPPHEKPIEQLLAGRLKFKSVENERGFLHARQKVEF